MTLSAGGWHRLRRAGFIDTEIAEFDQATTTDGQLQPTIDLNKPIWQAVMRSRYRWVQDKINRGWTKAQISDKIGEYYSKKGTSPWDFLKAEYRPARKTDFAMAAKRRAQRRLRRAGLR